MKKRGYLLGLHGVSFLIVVVIWAWRCLEYIFERTPLHVVILTGIVILYLVTYAGLWIARIVKEKQMGKKICLILAPTVILAGIVYLQNGILCFENAFAVWNIVNIPIALFLILFLNLFYLLLWGGGKKPWVTLFLYNALAIISPAMITDELPYIYSYYAGYLALAIPLGEMELAIQTFARKADK